MGVFSLLAKGARLEGGRPSFATSFETPSWVPLGPTCLCTLLESTCQAGRPSLLTGRSEGAGCRAADVGRGAQGPPPPSLSAAVRSPWSRLLGSLAEGAAPPPRMARVINCVTLEKSSLDHGVLHFPLQNAGDLINLLAEMAVGRPICRASATPSLVVHLNCKFS